MYDYKSLFHSFIKRITIFNDAKKIVSDYISPAQKKKNLKYRYFSMKLN